MASPNEHGNGLSPKKGLQGKRPTHLKVGKSSSKHQNQPLINQGQAPPPYRPPVIIYMKSPEVIHVEPQNFRNTVQHLTGNSSSTSLPSPLPASSGDGVDCTSIVGTSGKTGEEPQQQSTNVDVEDMLFLQNMSPWEPPSVPWQPTSSPTSLFPSPNVYPDFYDFDMMSSTPDYQDSNHGSTS